MSDETKRSESGTIIGFQLPLSKEEAEANKPLQGYLREIAAALVILMTPEDENQHVLISIAECSDKECTRNYPHVIAGILSERQMSEKFLVNLSVIMNQQKLTQNGKMITVEDIV
jgi:hypothetical protein